MAVLHNIIRQHIPPNWAYIGSFLTSTSKYFESLQQLKLQMNYSQNTHNYIQALEKLNRFKRGKLDLSVSYKLAKCFGNPHTHLSIIHVTGTNGKGSVAYKVANCLRLLGYKVGLFTSPHILSFRERFLIQNVMIDEDELINQIQTIFKKAEENHIEPTFFEVCTQIAFNYFAKNKVDWAVIEVGIGGRLDATNIIEDPKATVITSIGNDHIPVLGKNKDEIAFEKSGIFKPNCPVILGPTAVYYPAIYERAKALNCPIYEVQPDPRGLTFDQENKNISRAVIEKALGMEITEHLLDKGLHSKPPLRFFLLSNDQKSKALKRCLQNIPQTSIPTNLHTPFNTIIDVGHNETALERLSQDIGHLFPGHPVRVCVSQSMYRTLDMFLPLLNQFSFPNDNRLLGIHFITCDHPRLRDYDSFFEDLPNIENPELRKIFDKSSKDLQHWYTAAYPEITSPSAVYSFDNFEKLVQLLFIQATQEESVLLFCGTFFFTKNIIESLGLELGIIDPIQISDPPMSP